MFLHQPNLACLLVTPFGFESQTLAFLLVLQPQILAGHQRGVDRVEGQIGKKRSVLVGFDELRRLGRQPVGQMLAVRAIGQPRIAVGREIPFPAIRAATVDAAHVDVEPLILRPPAFRSQMPLARKERGVTGGFHGFRQRRGFQGKPVGVRRGQQQRVAFPAFGLGRCADIVRDPRPLRPLPGHDAGAGGRAHGTCRVGVGELGTLLCQRVDVRRLVERAAVAAQVALTEIIGQDEHDIGPSRSHGIGSQ